MNIKNILSQTSIYKKLYYPLRLRYNYYRALYFPKVAAKLILSDIMEREPDIDNPKDLNEKINYLKFHSDLNEWAYLADKFYVRNYVKSRGLESILIPLIAKFDTVQSFELAWDDLPNSFIIKNNHGSGDNIIITDKVNSSKASVIKMINNWNDNTDEFVYLVEPHYNIIKERFILVEELLVDTTGLSPSLIDYKIWCFDGKPYSFFICVDRDLITGKVKFDSYDLNWVRHPEHMAHSTEAHGVVNIELPKPPNFDFMLECAAILSKGHPQCRVDLYNVNGKVYFGEMTMTSQGGYMNYFTPEYLLEMGQQFEVK